MPTLKPRISITIDQDDLAVLDRYAAASGTPRASMISQLIQATIPELKRAAELMEMANAAPQHVIDGLVDDLANATADAMGFLAPFRSEYQLVLDGLDVGLSQGKQAEEKRRLTAGASVDASASARAPVGKRRRPSDPHLLTGGSNS